MPEAPRCATLAALNFALGPPIEVASRIIAEGVESSARPSAWSCSVRRAMSSAVS